ncbi:hypothetical protein HK098_006507 [Nowakowskiella sp. JEL0407]|nr:hypothetical protein HK098_006507 [Nowakowskiella sp. JEL0407]
MPRGSRKARPKAESLKDSHSEDEFESPEQSNVSLKRKLPPVDKWSKEFLFTNPKSEIVRREISDVLAPEVFEKEFTPEEQKRLLALLPVFEYDSDSPAEIYREIYRNKSTLIECAEEFQEDLAAGMYLPEFLEEYKRTEDAKIDEFDRWKMINYEEQWSEVVPGTTIAGTSAGISLQELIQADYIRNGDVFLYHRQFSLVKVVVSESVKIVRAASDGLEVRIGKQKKTTSGIQTLSSLENMVLDYNGKVSRKNRPNGNAWKIHLTFLSEVVMRMFANNITALPPEDNRILQLNTSKLNRKFNYDVVLTYRPSENPFIQKIISATDNDIHLQEIIYEIGKNPLLVNSFITIHSEERYECKITALHVAIILDKISLIRILIILSADVNLFDTSQAFLFARHPLYVATLCYSLTAVKILLESGADPDCKQISDSSNNWETPLFLMSKINNLKGYKMMYYCIKYGANVNFVGRDGNTPLSQMTKNHNPRGIALLQAAGATRLNPADEMEVPPDNVTFPPLSGSPSGATNQTSMPLIMNLELTNYERATLRGQVLRSQSGEPFFKCFVPKLGVYDFLKELHVYCIMGKFERCFHVLETSHRDLNVLNRKTLKHGFTPLYLAVLYNHTVIVEYLLAIPGIDSTVVPELSTMTLPLDVMYNTSLLNNAALNNNPSMAQTLLNSGLDPQTNKHEMFGRIMFLKHEESNLELLKVLMNWYRIFAPGSLDPFPEIDAKKLLMENKYEWIYTARFKDYGLVSRSFDFEFLPLQDAIASTLIHRAAAKDDVDLFGYVLSISPMLNINTLLNSRNRDMETPIMVAAKSGSLNILMVLDSYDGIVEIRAANKKGERVYDFLEKIGLLNILGVEKISGWISKLDNRGVEAALMKCDERERFLFDGETDEDEDDEEFEEEDFD